VRARSFHVAGGADHRRSVPCQHRGRLERFVRAPAGHQKDQPFTLVDLLRHERRGDGEWRAEQLLGRGHLPDVPIRRGQQIQIVLIVPVVFYRDPL
jgi:hypothetical protein